MSNGVLAPRLYVSYDPARDFYAVGLMRGNDHQWYRLRKIVATLIGQGYLCAAEARVDRNGRTIFTLGSITRNMQADEQVGHTACSFLEQWLRKQCIAHNLV